MIRRVRRRRLSEAVILRIRLAGFGLAACMLFSLLTIQLWQLQVVHGEQYREQAEMKRRWRDRARETRFQRRHGKLKER